MDWATAFAGLDIACIDEFGQSVTYSRPLSPNFAAVAQFTLNILPDTSGPYATPLGPEAGALFVRISDIPLGPQKGDLVTFLTRVYLVQEIVQDVSEGSAYLKIRWTGA